MKHARKLISIAVASAIAGNAHAFVLDGINTNGEYQNTQNWGFYDGNGTSLGDIPGSMSYGMDDTHIFVLLAAPTNFVDNVYGSLANDPASGWKEDTATGKKKVAKKKSGHSFLDLLNSDSIWFDLDIDGDGVADNYVEIDYLEDYGSFYGPEIITDGEIPVKATKKKATKKATKKGSIILGELIDGVATSLEYNLNQGTACVDDPANPVNSISGVGCEDQLMYEFTFLKTDVTGFSFDSVSGVGIHASPKKQGGSDIFIPCTICDPIVVPEPPVVALLMAGLAGLGWSRRGKKKP